MELATASDPKTGWETQLITGDAIDHYWPHIKGMLEKVPHTWVDYTLEAIYERITQGLIQVWGIGTKEVTLAIVFTQIATFPANRILEVIWMCGEKALDGLDVLDATLSEFARIHDCGRVDIYARPGWIPHAEKHGFKQSLVVLSRLVPKERIH